MYVLETIPEAAVYIMINAIQVFYPQQVAAKQTKATLSFVTNT